jgi:hypothetical protein
MTKGSIKAFPRKKLFIDILTQDVSAKTCILDLIDNSVDSYTRSKITERRKITITLNEKFCEIYDTCGGIEKEFLEEHVFRFGAEELNKDNPTLGMYGIGLKRSTFKMGNNIMLETDDGINYSLMELDVIEWENKDEHDWDIPYDFDKTNLTDGDKPYTKIKVTKLHDEIKEKFSLDTFKNDTIETIKRVYCLSMQEHIDYVFNDVKLAPYDLVVPRTDDYQPSVLKDEFNNVKIKIICFIDPSKGKRLTNAVNTIGWNLFCNNRLILANDTSETTGWTSIHGKADKTNLPKYHPIYNEFRGIVFLESDNPYNLPLNTSKSGLTTEDKVYQHVLKLMIETARPVIDYLTKKYTTVKSKEDDIEETMEQNIDESFEPTSVRVTDLDEVSDFKAPPQKEPPKEEMTSISYVKPKSLVEKVKSHLEVTSNKEVGSQTFDYYVDLEELDVE